MNRTPRYPEPTKTRTTTMTHNRLSDPLLRLVLGTLVASVALSLLLLTGCGDSTTNPGVMVAATGHSEGYSRVDRMGMPAIATAVITSKDSYNAANPTDDAAGMFVGEITASVDFLHGALDDDLAGAGLTPCATADCVGQAAPFVVPDVITLDSSQPAGFPNGRLLTDPVIDVTLALILLDLGTHGVTTLVGVNPTANDLPFLTDFPYVASAHQ